MTNPTQRIPFTIVPFEPHHQPDFYRLNAAWIGPNFGLEEEDVRFLTHPQREILDPGGAILMAQADLEGQPTLVGTAGLMKMDNDTYELIRLAVDERVRGQGLGKALTEAAIDHARRLGAARVILETSLQPVNAKALAMYERLGFRHYTPRPEHRSALDRAQVWMTLEPL